MKTMEEMIKELPPDLKQEVQDFVEFLYEKKVKKRSGKLKMNWAGALRELKDKYTSVELQHEISNWMRKDVSR
jgi:ubiquinone/menaquinone biosynthesis C-methylase UbiE